MHRIRIALAASTLLLVSICSAQQASTTDNKDTRSARDASPTGIDGPVIGGDGTRNFIPLWISPGYLLSSILYQASGGNIGVGTTTPAAKLDVNGGINTATTYQIGGSNVVSIGIGADLNLFLGVGAGNNTTACCNTFTGYQAGYSNTTGGDNVFAGSGAGLSNTRGMANTFVGNAAGYANTTTSGNAFYGSFSGENNIADNNTFIGTAAGSQNTTGYGNTFTGYQAGIISQGNANTYTGYQAGYNTSGASGNTFYGYEAGINNINGGNDIYIGNQGPSSDESDTIRIGDPNYQGFAYMAGIYGVNVGGVPVQINSSGQLGAQTSSRRFKEQVRDMGDSTSALMKLRPVTFLYKPEYAKGERTLQYGLIAEEVARVYPELVANDQDGQPYTVRYQYITTMLLNEVQKQYHRAEAEAKVITAQEQKIDDLEQRLSRLEKLIPQTVARK